MMLQLTKEYWHNFKRDGLLFEELVGELLQLEYPGLSFIRTKTTYDGSRDWEINVPVLNDLDVQIWFECKYYQENLPAQAIAMTLVMAYAENAKQIVFFSYSPVNREFPKKIGRFSERAGIPVRIYDDISLEQLILQHWNKLDIKKYFPNMPPKNRERTLLGLSGYCEVEKGGKRLSPHREKILPVVQYNDVLTLRFTLLNHDTHQDYSILVWIDDKYDDFFHICEKEPPFKNHPRTLVVRHNELAIFSLRVKLKKFGDKISLPTLRFEWNGKTGFIRSGYVEGQWLAETELIGQSFYDTLAAQDKMMRCAAFTVSLITGHSGVGKSRMTREIALQAQMEGKQAVQIDFDFGQASYISFIRKLVSELEGMPVLPTSKTVQFSRGENWDRDMAVQILYDDDFFRITSDSEINRYLFEKMGQGKVWLILLQ